MAANGEVENEELEKNLSPAHQFAEKVFSDSKISFRCTVKKPDGTTCGKTYAVSVKSLQCAVMCCRGARE